MKNFFLVTSALVVIASAQPGRAADQSAAPQLPTKTKIVPAAITNWTGCYIGAHGGGGAVSDTFVGITFFGNNNFLHGGNAVVGGQIGCNYQNGVMVFGLEGEAWSGLTNAVHFVPGAAFIQDFFGRNQWSADVATRAGLAFDRALLYGKAGIAQGRFAFSSASSGGALQNGAGTLTGTLLGVGLEYGFAPNWSAKLEYDHIEYAGRTVHIDGNLFAGGPFKQTESASADLIKAGVNYRFGGPGVGVGPIGAAAPAAVFKALPSRTPTSAAFNWTGCYAGLHGGGGWMRDTFVGGSFAGGGGVAGGQLGCNVQPGAIVWGLEGEAAWSGLTDKFHFDTPGPSFTDFTTSNRWSADIAARAGVAVDRTVIFGKAGIAAGHFDFSFVRLFPQEIRNGSATFAGLLLGAGIEYAFAPNWSAKLEYNNIDYFSGNVGFDDTRFGPRVVRHAAATNVLKLGVNYRFSEVPFAPAMDRAASGLGIVKAPIYKAPAAAVANWTGCYIGVHGGGGTLADSLVLGGSDSNPVPLSSGGFAGGQLGCDYQTGALVFGLEGEAAWSRIVNNSQQTGGGLTPVEKSSGLVWAADVVARTGLAIDRGLFYGKAGLALGRVEFSFTRSDGVFDNAANTFDGLLLGAGIEYALAPHWSVLLEYDRIDYASPVVHFATSRIRPFSENLTATVNQAKAGINYRFGGAALPAAAEARPLLPPPVTDWTGCYAGVHAGGGVIDDTFVPPFAGATARGSGALAGAQGGCNVQTGIMVFGLEGEAAWSSLVNRSSLSAVGGITTAQTSDRNPWNADIAARGGFAFDHALFYGKSGVAAGRFNFFETDTAGHFLQGGMTLTGLLLGLGVEFAFAPNWSAKLEYDHIGYLSHNVALGRIGSSTDSATTNTVKAGINYKFVGPSAIVVARD